MTRDELNKYIDGAVRMALDSVSFSNPLPPWEDQTEIPFNARAALIRKRAADYLSGADTARPPTHILVPRKEGPPRVWTVPSVNDQIILQLCAFALSDRLERVVDRKRVFSYQPNADVTRVALTAPQVSSWESFKNATRSGLRGGVMLQIDLEKAFDNIDRASFFRFLGEVTGDTIVPELLERVLQRLSLSSKGLPLINDSLFYLGNTYLTVVDREVAAVTHDFIRFVDDYRIFGDSKDHLDLLLQRINERLAQTSFRINPRKTKLGDENEYLTAIGAIREAKTHGNNEYVSVVELSGVADPAALAALVIRTIFRPGDLTEGMGRYLMQAVRRMRLNHEWAMRRTQAESPLTPFGEALQLAIPAEAVIAALQRYAIPAEEWRFIWVLYVMEDLESEVVKTFVKSVNPSPLSPVARAWLSRASGGKGRGLTIDEQHDMPYADVGRALYGAT